MAKRDEPKTWKLSRYSSLGYGVMIDGVLPSVGPERCVYADRCPAVFRSLCVAGSPCPNETLLFVRFISSATKHHEYAKSWLTESEYRDTIRKLAILSLQNARLSYRCTHALEQAEEDSEDVTTALTGISNTRYATALRNKQIKLTNRLLDEATVLRRESVYKAR